MHLTFDMPSTISQNTGQIRILLFTNSDFKEVKLKYSDHAVTIDTNENIYTILLKEVQILFFLYGKV